MMRALITGTVGGMGQAFVRLFLERGAMVTGMDVLPMPASFAASLGQVDAARYTHVVADICDKNSLPELEPFDIVICNAGIQTPSMEHTGKDIAVNLVGSMNVAERYAFQPQIKSLLFNASVSAVSGDEFPEYAASKAGVVGYMKNCAKRLARSYHATCNALCLGGVKTELNRPVMDDAKLWSRIMEVTPLKRWATPEEAAEWADFLTVTNKFCTGQAIVVDGGEKDCNSTFVWPE